MAFPFVSCSSETMTTSDQEEDKQIGLFLSLNWQVTDSLAASKIQTSVLNYSYFFGVTSTAYLFSSQVVCLPGFSARHSSTTFSDIQYVQAYGRSTQDLLKTQVPTSVVRLTLQT